MKCLLGIVLLALPSTGRAEVPQQALELLQTPMEMSSHDLPPTGQPAIAQEPVLSLESCVQLALRSATDILKAKNDRESASMQLLQGWAQFLPNLQSSGNYTYQNGTSYFALATPVLVNTNNVGLGYTVSSTLNIFNGFADISNLKSALFKKEASDLTLFRAKQSVVLDATQTFLQVILDNQLLRIAKKNLALSQARQSLLEEQTRVGVRNLSDLFRQQAQTSADELLLINSQNKVRTDQILLLRKLRLDVSRNYQLKEPLIEPGKADLQFQDESQMIRNALEKRADLKASQAAADAGRWDVRNARAAYLPHLDLGFNLVSGARLLHQQTVAGVNVVPPTQTDLFAQLGPQTYYTAGLTLTFNLFDRWISRLAVAKAQNIADNLSVDAQDQFLKVQGDVRQAYGDYQTSLQQLDSSRKGQEAAQKAYEVTQGRYEVGSASFVDLITAQVALVQAEANRAQALIGFLLQTKTMDFAQGLTPVDGS